ncbi:hypothetical protein CPB84DRAFT_1692765, partial [Gymnopilus junonius]
LLGGLVGRIASKVVPDIKIWEGPSLTHKELVAVHGDKIFIDDKADYVKVEIVCGVYLQLEEASMTASHLSWWPKHDVWMGSGYAIPQWSPDTEKFYQDWLAGWKKGVFELKKMKE